ncbi:MAG: hypothetical protein Q9191_004239 [Dirinaria sp. TL-2023a]
MPLGITRLNARHQQPNSRITFIKPLPGSTSEYAQDFLERIAAICHPIMKANHLSITTLEEYEPNAEFVGRNFNAGEIIQLVLRARNGQWLNFRSVQMVMMHELAHCMQMNHSGAFWKVRNQYAEELRGLWGKGYTGDGFWGKGKTILSERYENTQPVAPEIMPSNLCGGTFRSRRRKRKRKSGAAEKTITYAERQQRRIEKKFGTNGVALGGDEEARVKLEYGQKKVKAKPRVAGSSRGRELRAAAALARFGQQKEEESTKEGLNKEEAGSESGSDTEDDYQVADEGKEAVNVDGSRILDGKGQGMVRVCENEDSDDIYVKQELQELQDLEHVGTGPQTASSSRIASEDGADRGANPATHPTTENDPEITNITQEPMSRSIQPSSAAAAPNDGQPAKQTSPVTSNKSDTAALSCEICSMANEPTATTCTACLHVLDTTDDSTFWRCNSDECKESRYINSVDTQWCGVCQHRRRG